MKTHPLIVIAATVSMFLVVVQIAQAQLNVPFGGQIISTKTPGISCAAQYGPILMRPVNLSVPGLYAIRSTTKSVRAGQWALGLYNLVPSFTTCYTDSTPPVPVPTFMINPTIFGTSGR